MVVKKPIPFGAVIPLGKDQTWQDLPEPESLYFVVAKEGLYLRSKTLSGHAIVPYKGKIPGVGSIGENSGGAYVYSMPPLPPQFLAMAVDFFRKVFDEHKTEAGILILQNPGENKFGLAVPPQEVTRGSVHYHEDATKYPDGWQQIGSIHSHCDGGAFHSGIDSYDASVFDGVHITIGHVNSNPTFDAMVSISGFSFSYDIETIADTSDLFSFTSPDDWMSYLTFPKPAWENKDNGGYRYGGAMDYEPWGEYIGSRQYPPHRSPNEAKNKKRDKLNGKRWSKEFQRMIPEEFLNTKGEIPDDLFLDAIEDQLREIEIICLDRGYNLLATLKPVGESTIESLEKESIDETPILLPGPFSVSETE